MTTGRGRAIDDTDTTTADELEDERRRRSATSRESAGRSTLSRRQALSALGSVSIAATAGCLSSPLNVFSDQTEVTPTEPGENPDGTPGEFYFLLEQNGIGVDELYHNPEEGELILFYESDADDFPESDAEIGTIYQVFSGGLIDRGSDVEYLFTEVKGGFDGQVDGWRIERRWVEQHQNGEIDEHELWENIVDHKVYEGEHRYLDEDQLEEADGADGNRDGDGNGNGTGSETDADSDDHAGDDGEDEDE
ncbi:hypothetical protein [Halobiforma nitratireducens]|uniref:DUF8159 domain-containing protein n=1 Tax=Halobiforma nitratireducens JCM 10879 TaxID=1227454 RepID=M0LFN2_9EURY|nr:hypothetical protein [Halobiforma nitratireducens]EMA32392.1 hypothetical protein C446_14809 [Halobiforma nitratireducens JCM 10879]